MAGMKRPDDKPDEVSGFRSVFSESPAQAGR